uniref:MARVEL domain-containing protein n=1 Tax=Bursaphelenchus xylophilus TaxID=6326 RepID=A0A1I7RIB5_BURXY
MRMSDKNCLLDVNRVKIGCLEGTAKQTAIGVGTLGCILSIVAVIALLIDCQYSVCSLIYFLVSLLVIFGAHLDNRFYFWPFLFYNGLLIIVNFLATVSVIVLYFSSRPQHHRNPDVSDALVLAAVAFVLVLITLFNILVEYVIVICYGKTRSNRDSTDEIARV